MADLNHGALSAGATSGTRGGRPPRPLHLLVVDDESSVREVLALMLTQEGHDVVTAQNGAEALDFFVRDRWDVVITDRSMPIMRGDELAAKIKQWSPETPVVLLTGFAGPMELTGTHARFFDMVLHKPFTVIALREGLEWLMSVDRSPERQPPGPRQMRSGFVNS